MLNQSTDKICQKSTIPINVFVFVLLFALLQLPKYDDVIKWKHFPRCWPFVWGIHRASVNSPHKGQWRGALMFSLICTWINGWVNNGVAGDLRRHRSHYDVIVMGTVAMLVALSALKVIAFMTFEYFSSPVSKRLLVSIGIFYPYPSRLLNGTKVILKGLGKWIVWFHRN